MKHPFITSLGLAVLASVSLVTPASAGMPLWNYSTDLDNTFDFSLSSPYVGSMTFSFYAPSPLADGNYALSSFLYSPTFEANFDNGQMFTLADMSSPIENVNVYLSGLSFVFTCNAALDSQGSADFRNINGYYLTTEPLFNDGSSRTRGEILSALYMVQEGGLTSYEGNYGSLGAIPEVTSSMLALISSGLLLRRRTKALR
jgi:hypothetical protein